jgi:hypothetical protein
MHQTGHTPDGMGADRHRERLNMAEASKSHGNIYAIVTRSMDVVQSGFSTHDEAAEWLENRLDSYKEPDWNEENVEIQAIR